MDIVTLPKIVLRVSLCVHRAWNGRFRGYSQRLFQLNNLPTVFCLAA